MAFKKSLPRPLPGDVGGLYSQVDRLVLFPSGDHELPMVSAVQMLDEEVENLWAVIAALNARRNTLAFRYSVLRLPDDVFSMIFHYAVDPADPFASTDSETDSSTALSNALSYAQVCRRWRVVLLADPTMWTTLDFEWQKATSLLLSYSRQSPLFVRWKTSDGEPVNSNLMIVLGAIDRIQTLDLTMPRSHYSRDIVDRLNSASRLETLSLTYARQEITDFLWFLNAQSLRRDRTRELPSSVLPSVQRLFLNGVIVSWQEIAKSFPSLRILSISGLSLSYSLSVAELVGMLATLPLLEGLHLSHALGHPQSEEDPTPHIPNIVMRRLRDVSLKFPRENVDLIQLTTLLSIPTDCRIALALAEQESRLLDHLRFPASCDSDSESGMRAPTEISIEFKGARLRMEGNRAWKIYYDAAYQHDFALRTFMKMFNLSQVRTLSITVPTIAAAIWNLISNECPCLETLKMNVFAVSLLGFARGAKECQYSPVYFPCLREIESFQEKGPFHTSKSDEKLFAEYLRGWRAAGKRLTKVTWRTNADGVDWSGTADEVVIVRE